MYIYIILLINIKLIILTLNGYRFVGQIDFFLKNLVIILYIVKQFMYLYRFVYKQFIFIIEKLISRDI